MAVAVIASVTGASSGGGGFTTDAADTTGASLLIVASDGYIAQASQSISDSESNTWTLMETISHEQGLTRFYYVDSDTPSVGAGHDVSLSISGAYGSAVFVAFDGTTATPMDQEVTGTFTSATSAGVSSALTPSADNCLIVAVLGFDTYGVSGVGINSGMELLDYVPAASGAHFGTAVAWKQQSTAAAINPTWSWTGSATGRTMLFSFTATGPPAGGGGNPWYSYAQQRRRPRLPRWLRSVGGIFLPQPILEGV